MCLRSAHVEPDCAALSDPETASFFTSITASLLSLILLAANYQLGQFGLCYVVAAALSDP